MLNLAGIPFEKSELIRRALANLRPCRGEKKAPRWSLVSHSFGVGSTVAYAMCREFGFDPDEEIAT